MSALELLKTIGDRAGPLMPQSILLLISSVAAEPSQGSLLLEFKFTDQRLEFSH
jgi:hypothetical protein